MVFNLLAAVFSGFAAGVCFVNGAAWMVAGNLGFAAFNALIVIARVENTKGG